MIKLDTNEQVISTFIIILRRGATVISALTQRGSGKVTQNRTIIKRDACNQMLINLEIIGILSSK